MAYRYIPSKLKTNQVLALASLEMLADRAKQIALLAGFAVRHGDKLGAHKTLVEMTENLAADLDALDKSTR